MRMLYEYEGMYDTKINAMLKLNHEYYVVEMNNVLIPERMFDWLELHVQKGDYFIKHPNIYFANKNDHFMFILRFSGEKVLDE